MNYVLYIVGTGSIVLGILGFGQVAQVVQTDQVTKLLANSIIIYGSASLIIFGLFCCAFGSAIGLLKKIARNTRAHV